MNRWPFRLIVGSTRILAVAIIVIALVLGAFLLASPLIRSATAALGERVAVAEWQPRDLSAEWQWRRESVQVDQMYRQSPERAPRGSFDRVLDMARQ